MRESGKNSSRRGGDRGRNGGRDSGRNAGRNAGAGRKDKNGRVRHGRETGPARDFRESRSFKKPQEDRAERSDLLIGRNPVTEALKSGRSMEKVILQKGGGGSLGMIARMAREQGIVVEETEKTALDRLSGGGAHQGAAAIVSAHRYAELEDVLNSAKDRGEDPFLVVLDGIEDPHNLGAIMRTAECAGAHGVIIPKRRAVGLTETVAKSSAGAIEYMPVVRVTNIAMTLEKLKEQGIWIYACDMDGVLYTEQSLTGPAAIVVGAEGSGVSRLVREKCDSIVSIPMRGRINSLNASNAAAILMYEIRRQRDAR